MHFPPRTLYKVTLAAITTTTKIPKLGNDLNTTAVYFLLIERPKQLFLVGRLLSSTQCLRDPPGPCYIVVPCCLTHRSGLLVCIKPWKRNEHGWRYLGGCMGLAETLHVTSFTRMPLAKIQSHAHTSLQGSWEA